MIEKNFAFISGLPRSGSTLLCNILAQNPETKVSKATSGLHDVLFGVRNQWDRLIEHQAEGVDSTRLKRVLQGIFHGYLHDGFAYPLVIDKGRGWLSLIEMLEFVLDKKCKIICPVRDLAEILASFEKLWRNTTAKTQWNFEKNDYFDAQTVEGRCAIWAHKDQPVGLAYNRVKDALQRGYSDRMHFVEFNDLTSYPERTLEGIYKFLNVANFKHDFDNVTQYTQEDDENVHRIVGLHAIRPKVLPVPRSATETLGEVAKKYRNLEVWR